MLILIGYVLLLILLLVFLIFMTVYTLSLIYSSIMGSPYVATRNKVLEEILKEAGLKKGKVFYELGSGDGRMSRTATKIYGVKSVGVDINPLLVYWSNFLAKMQKLEDCSFVRKNIFDLDLTGANCVYIFLMPELITKLTPKLKKELKKGTVVISHGFRVIGLQKNLFKTTDVKGSLFKTYYYRI